ncbi:DUF2786 domain-containing protein [Streptomyces zagrosensis]|uniref:DUF2786 domain-containing protein n=1 Tax=Streptomyces zagrosensis TaxID=1042984 RepID=A0A7W9QGA8_9ACTN|nr:DUF2786 domain-containing protein [Streptomyces zagrosensis]MBB5939178.1 hypothetical protein [Streptomyces zagrosensis]
MSERGAADALVDRVLREALSVPVGADANAVDLALDAGASALTAAPDGLQATSRALLRAAGDSLALRWSSGWYPADVVRLVRRELPADRVRLITDLIADEARRHPAERLPARWVAQLGELAATVWWDGGQGGYLEAFARRERSSRFDTARCALDVLRCIGRLPPLTPIGPPPGGGARPGGARGGDWVRDGAGRFVRGSVPGSVRDGAGRAGERSRPAEPRLLERVRALLAKAESTEYPEEAEALSAKAQQLMARYSIDEALLAADDWARRGAADAAGGDGAGPDACRIGVEGPYESAKALLLGAVAEANRCHAVWSAEFGFSTVVGYEADLELVELLHTSLLVQATTAMRRAGDRHHAKGRSRRTRDFRESFLIAYAGRIRERLLTATRQAETAAQQDAAQARTVDPLPVLAARGVSVGEATGRMFPQTVTHRLKGRDSHGWASGIAAADEAALG